ncbi:unnamed protein product [Cochlearia groenlandica]
MEISFVPSRFPDPETLKKLEIYDEVREILRHMRLDGVLGIRHNAYKEETCQFLATLEISYIEPGPQGIRFSYTDYNGKIYSAGLDVWGRILGFPADGQTELTN